MTAEGLLAYDEETRRYSLGPKLILFGAAAIGSTTPIAIAAPYMNTIASDSGLACLAINRMPDGEFIAVEKVESRRDIKVTIEVGERFPPDSPLLSRLWLAWDSKHQPPTPPHRYTGSTLTDLNRLERAVRDVRSQGFADAYGEYIPNLNVVGVPIFGADQMPRLAVTVLGIGADLSPHHVRDLAPRLVVMAREVTRASGGRLPDDYPTA